MAKSPDRPAVSRMERKETREICFCVILTSGPDQLIVHVLSILFDHSLPATIARVTVTTYVVSSVLMVVVEMS